MAKGTSLTSPSSFAIYLPLNETSGSTAHDYSSNGNDGTVENPAPINVTITGTYSAYSGAYVAAGAMNGRTLYNNGTSYSLAFENKMSNQWCFMPYGGWPKMAGVIFATADNASPWLATWPGSVTSITQGSSSSTLFAGDGSGITLGAGQSVNVGNHSGQSLTGPLTICVEIANFTSVAGEQVIFGKSGGGAGYCLFVYGGAVYLKCSNLSASYTQISGGSLATATAYRIVGVIGASNAYLYINGTQVATCGVSGSISTASVNCRLGNDDAGDGALYAKVRQAFVLPSAWTSTDVAAWQSNADEFYAAGSRADTASSTIATSGKASLSVLKTIGASGSSLETTSRTVQASGKSLETVSKPIQAYGGSGIESASAAVQAAGKTGSTVSRPLAASGATLISAARAVAAAGQATLSLLRGIGASGNTGLGQSRSVHSYGAGLPIANVGLGAYGGDVPPVTNAIKTGFFPYLGGSSLIQDTGTVTALAPAAFHDATITHKELLQLGDLLVSGLPEGVTATILEHHRAVQFVVRFTNMTSYPVTFTYTWQRRGRLLYYGQPGRDDANQPN